MNVNDLLDKSIVTHSMSVPLANLRYLRYVRRGEERVLQVCFVITDYNGPVPVGTRHEWRDVPEVVE